MPLSISCCRCDSSAMPRNHRRGVACGSASDTSAGVAATCCSYVRSPASALAISVIGFPLCIFPLCQSRKQPVERNQSRNGFVVETTSKPTRSHDAMAICHDCGRCRPPDVDRQTSSGVGSAVVGDAVSASAKMPAARIAKANSGTKVARHIRASVRIQLPNAAIPAQVLLYLTAAQTNPTLIASIVGHQQKSNRRT